MSRFNPHHETEALYAASAEWFDKSWKNGSSILSDEADLWSTIHLEELYQLFVQQPDEGTGAFIAKLRDQLSEGSPSCKRLMAELMWVLNLFPSNIGPTSKRNTVQEIWSWSGPRLPDDLSYLRDEVLTGVGSTGTAYSTLRWRELGFFIQILLDYRRQPAERQRDIANDPWSFVLWLQTQEGASNRQLPHVLTHLIFPDTFERISSAGNKRDILGAFTTSTRREWARRSLMEIDKALLSLREDIEAESDVPVDFYIDPWVSVWRPVATINAPENVVASDSAFAAKLRAFLSAFETARLGPFGLNQNLSDAVAELREWLKDCAPVATRPTITVKVGIGQGGWTKTPWIALMDSRVTTSTQRGIYVVLLVSEDLATTYLTLNQGMTDLVNQLGQRGAVAQMHMVAEEARPLITTQLSEIFTLDRDIDLRSLTSAARNYEQGTIAHKSLPTSDIPDDQTILEALEALLDAYEQLIEPLTSASPEVAVSELYTIDDALKDLFFDQSFVEEVLDIWKAKKNVILQGAPGVGKSYVARRLAYALMGKKDNRQLEAVQFHQSYSYEDFVRGFRPNGEGGFTLEDGIFLDFCTRAMNSDQPHILVIDEINRGNLSKILGELMLLVEHDKRGDEWATKLAYKRADELPFFVPENLYILGMMNTADRSLSMVDYALRRRFAFIDVEPQFHSDKFKKHLLAKGVPADLVERIVSRMTSLNDAIWNDRVNLGPGFRIGHSFFTPSKAIGDHEQWYRRVVNTEVFPLLKEYWFDDPTKAEQWQQQLLG